MIVYLDGFFTKVFHKMAKDGIYKLPNGDMVQKWHALFRLAPVLLFFLLPLILVFPDFDSENVVNNNGETSIFILFLPWYNEVK